MLQKRKLNMLFICLLSAICVITASISVKLFIDGKSFVLASESYHQDSLSVMNPSTQITNTWGTWEKSENSLTAKNGNDGNLFAMADIYVAPHQDLVFEAELTRLDNTNIASLVFGVSNKEDPGAGWFGVNIRYDMSKAFLYSERIGSLGFNENERYASFDGANNTNTLKIEAFANGNIKAFLNGQEFASVLDTSYKGGYIGFLTFFGSFTFDNIKYSVIDSNDNVTNAPVNPMAQIKNTWGTWEKTPTSLTARNGNDGNLFAMTDIFIKEDQNLTFEAELTRLDNTNIASLVFGVSNKEDPGAGWFGVNIRYDMGKAFLYSERIGSLGFNENERYASFDGANNTNTLKIQAFANGNIKTFLNGQEFASVTDTSYKGGYIGFLTFFGSFTFNNIKYSITDDIAIEGAVNPSAQITNVWGNWEKTPTSLTARNGNDGNLFAMTDIYVASNQDMLYEAKITRLDNTNIASLVFGVSNKEDPGAGWFGVNIRYDMNKAFLYSERIGSLGFNENERYATHTGNSTYTLRIEALANGNIKAYLDGVLFADVTDTSYKGGYVGFLTFFGNFIFEDIRCVVTESNCDLIDAPINPSIQIKHTWGTWEKDSISVTARNRNDGNLFAMTDIFVEENEDLSFEATITRLDDSACASLVFGVSNKEDPGAGWFGVNLRCDLGKAFVYSDRIGSLGFNENLRYATLEQSETNVLRVEAFSNGVIKAYLNDVLFTETFDSNYKGGYIGLLTFFGSFKFENMKYSITKSQDTIFETNGKTNYVIDSYRSSYTWANWQFNEDNTITATNIGTANEFSMSTLHVEKNQNFYIEADLAVEGTSAGIGFGISQINDPIKGWYGIIVDKNAGVARVFSENKATLGAASKMTTNLTPEQHAAQSVNIRIEVSAGGVLSAYLDGVLFAREYDGGWNGGYIGFNTFYANATFSNIKFSIWNQTEGLSNLSIAEVPFTFNSATSSYVVEIPTTEKKATCPTDILATPSQGYTVSINGISAERTTVNLTSSKSIIEIVATHDETGKTSLYYLILKCSLLEEYRPNFHFTERETWINDPNGLVYDATTDTYHMFYQYCEGINNDSYFYWGHAVSSDLVNWERKAPAIAPDQNGIIFSGSCVIDENNTSGLFDDSTPPASRLVAFFTYHQDNPSIGLAYSTDFGETWIKHGKVIANENNVYGNHFRDPKVIFTNGKWLMITGGWTNVRLFSSNDLLTWHLDSEVKDYFGNNLQSECPDIFPLAVDGDVNNTKWVITTGGTSYIVGSLDMNNGNFVFTAETPGYKMYNGAELWSNVGEMYATQSFYNDKLGRRILVSWMIDRTANLIDEKCWNGAESLPLETELITLNGMIVMRGYPVQEISSLRSDVQKEVTDLTIDENSPNLFEEVKLKTFDLEMQIEVGTATMITLEVRKGENESIIIKYDVINSLLILDVSQAGKVASYKAEASVSTNNGILTLRIVMDSSIIDIFAQNGVQSFHGFVFPDKNSNELSLKIQGGKAIVKSLKLWDMGTMQ